ncbi:hypothetical protein [Methylobacterium indicum]|uniref:Tip attachment protein J domain-containing protein n=1 Tax=Methylobacterium indicum TaxID=1775910 RepID=A0ABR5GZ33_9HYPH|nr:hypothetical protein [Methylobacterium indicum]KMO15768.1 hypothetical protein QR79_23815 [Methylobacterium indicum]KMO18044.1 hypothetical protein QR78_16160 [Methylobacterium indicum]
MAEVIGAAIISAATAAEIGAAVGVSAAVVTTAVGSAAIIAGGAALNLIASSLTDDRQKQAATQFSSQQPMPSRQRSYGRVKVAGPRVAYGVIGGAFCYGLYHGEGPWDAIEEWWLDDIQISFPAGSLGGSVPNVPWRGYVSIDSRLGTVPQAASGLLSGLDGYDASYRLDGCAFSAVQSRLPPEKKFKAYYPKQTWSELRVTARTQKVRDVRDPAQTEDPATWKFTDRSGPNIYDFLTHPLWGLRIPHSMMNTAKWAAFNSLCDEVFTDKAGNPVNRYSLGGTYQLTDDPADTLNAMLSTCDGTLRLEADGTIGITGGKFPTPTVTITDPAILAMQINVGGSRYFEFNRLKLSFVSPPHDYQQVEGQAWDDATAQAASGELIEQDFARPWVQNYNQLRRLAKIAMAKGNPDLKITGLVTDLSAAPALFEDSVRLILSDLGIDAVFLVMRAVANVEAGTCTFDFASLDPSAYSFDPATEEGTAPTLPGAQAAEGPPADPQGLTVSVERKPVSGSTNATFLRLTATPADRQDYSLIGRYRLQGDTDWTEMAQDTDDQWSLVSGVLNDGAVYEVQGAVASYGRARVSNYLAADGSPITATADTNSPGPPTGVVANGGSGQASYAFTMPNSANAARAAVYRNTADNLRTATLVRTHNASPSQSIDGTITGLAPGTYYVWVRALNASGYPALPSNPATPDPDASSTVRAPNPVTVT